MNSAKKLILMSLIPAVLTIFFIVVFTIPAVSNYLDLNKQIKKHKLIVKNTKSSVERLKANKKMANDLEKLNTELIGFDVEFPLDFKDEILLIDMEVFANESINRIMELQAFPEKEIDIIDPKEEKKKKKQTIRPKEKKIPPVQIFEKPFSLNTVAYYNEIIDFVKFLESYQRKINISGISAKIFNEDSQSINPRIQMNISASSYKSKINEVANEEDTNEEQPQKAVSTNEKAKNAKSKK